MRIVAQNDVSDNTGKRMLITVSLENGTEVDVMQYYPQGRMTVYVMDPHAPDIDEVEVTSFVRREIYKENEKTCERTCKSLLKGEKVVFLVKEHGDRKSVFDGNVVKNNSEEHRVVVSYLAGWKDRLATIPYRDMLGVYRPGAEIIDFGGLIGPSDWLIPE